MPRIIPFILGIALAVFALVDCVQTPDERTQGIPRWAWILLIVLIPWIGPIAWLIAGKDRSSRPRGGHPSQSAMGTRGARSAPRNRSLAPDDDPEFLRKLDEDIQRERRERERREREQREREQRARQFRDRGDRGGEAGSSNAPDREPKPHTKDDHTDCGNDDDRRSGSNDGGSSDDGGSGDDGPVEPKNPS